MSIEKSYFDLEPIKDIDEFINRVKELNKKDQWIFRGQKESNWKLIPGTGRYSNKSYDKVLKIWVCQKACPHHPLKTGLLGVASNPSADTHFEKFYRP